MSYEKFCQLRDERGVNDYKVAKDTGIGQSTFSDWKSGRSKPKMGKIIKIARYFDVPVTYFYEEQ